MKTKNKYFLIKSGPMLDAVKEYIDKRIEVIKAASIYAKKVGSKSYFHTDHGADLITGFYFAHGNQPDGWTKPKRNGFSKPKKSCEDFQSFKELPVGLDDSKLIANLLDLKLGISYKTETGSGHTFIGNPFNECGFLYPSKNGPYAFWIPDILAACKDFTDKGYTITNGADKWDMELKGVEEITEEKWDYLVAKDKFERLEAENQ